MLAGASVTKTEQWAVTALFAHSHCRPETGYRLEQADRKLRIARLDGGSGTELFETFGKANDLQIHTSLTIVSQARNTDRLGFLFLGNDPFNASGES